jgi:hypothetical protein
MKLMHSILVAAALTGMSSAMADSLVPGPIAVPAAPALQGAMFCTCSDGFITPGGNPQCTQYTCHPIEKSVPLPKITSSLECPESRMLFCESNTCTLT